MATLLILGSKPDPVLPPPSSVDAVACANAAGYSAARHGMPTPDFTVISAIVTSGIGSGRQSMTALDGLATKTLYFLPSTSQKTRLNHYDPLKLLKAIPYALRVTPAWFRHAMKKAGFHWDTFEIRKIDALLAETARKYPFGDELTRQLARKRPSTGLATLLIGLSLGRYDRFVISGFSFELTHAYADNPEIGERGTRDSGHAPTDIMLLQFLSRHSGNIFTTEPSVHELAKIPLLTDT